MISREIAPSTFYGQQVPMETESRYNNTVQIDKERLGGIYKFKTITFMLAKHAILSQIVVH